MDGRDAREEEALVGFCCFIGMAICFLIELVSMAL
jgi:hypothetical protein